MNQLKVAKKRITLEDLMGEGIEGAFEAIQHLRSIAGDYGCEPRDRIAASCKLLEAYPKLASLVEVEPTDSLPVLRAINGSR